MEEQSHGLDIKYNGQTNRQMDKLNCCIYIYITYVTYIIFNGK